ncbi:MAG TPA: hypothetical protein ENK19_09650 [Acidobacteria bacterium]|nr:hypothetical protein [Acidobacteriota bacterium]
MGDIAMDASGDIAVGFSISSSTTYPSVAWAGRLVDDPAGELSQGEAIVVAGAGSQTHSAARWGDYSSMSVDPVDDCTFWYTQEYMPTTGSAPWQTRIAAFKFPSCTTGPSGTVHGTVTNSSTGDPIEGATVSFVSGTNNFSTTTAPDGTYAITVPADTYDITASAFGFTQQTVTGIVVGDGDDITQDFALDPVGTAFIDGYVTGALHGWPLYARIKVFFGGTEVASVFTNPFNGYYEVELPQGNSYDLNVTSMIDGYVPATRTVTLAASGNTESFALANDGSGPWMSCYLDGGVVEDFEGTFPPGGWKSVDNIGSGHVWVRNDEIGSSNRTGGTGFDAAADSDATCGAGPWDTTLYSPLVKLPATPAKGIKFNSNFQDFAGAGQAWFEISSDGGSTWTTLWYSSSDDPGGTTGGGVLRQFDLSAYAGMTVQFRWRYTDDGDGCAWFWHIDNVTTYELSASAQFPPAGWSVVDNLGGGPVWDRNDILGVPNRTNGSGQCAAAEGSGMAWDTTLFSPSVDLTSAAAPHVLFQSNFQDYAGNGDAWFDISSDGGTTWTNLYYSTSDDGPNQKDIDLTAYAGSTVQFRWRYACTSSTSWYWHVDDVDVQDGGTSLFSENFDVTPPPPEPTPTLTCEPVGGALMEGFVLDGNTSGAVNGASVSDDVGDSASSMATPDDPAIGDGFYWMFTKLDVGNGPATRTFTASANGYTDAVVSTNPSPDAVNRLDFDLLAGWLEVTPTQLTSRLYSGQTEDQAVTITNHGGVDANVSLLSFESAGWVPSMPMDAVPAPSVPAAHLNDRTAQAANVPQHDPATPLAAGDVISSWPTGLTYGWGLGVNKNADNLWVGNIGAGGGDDLDYEYTRAGTQTGNTVDTSSWMGGWAADMAFDPAAGTMWQLAVGGDNCIHEWDPVAQTSTGNSICWGSTTSERGLAYDPISDTFFVGGWNTNAITRFDRHGTVMQVANVGIAISGLAYNPTTGHLFVQENSPTDTVYVLDVNDNYNVIGSFTVSGMGSYGGAGLGFTCDGHLWAINQATQTVIEVDSGEMGACMSASLPWFVATPDSGVVAANEGTLPIDGQFIADGAPHWGLVQGNVLIIHDTPYPVDDIHLCLTKAFNDVAPSFWGDAYVHALAGARISMGCGDGNFCPTDIMTRGVMANWLVKVMHGPDFMPMPCQGTFADVICESTPNANYIEQLYADGVTTGCDPGPPLLYCPDDPVTRAQMATFITRAAYGPDFVPPAPTGTVYPDVAPGQPGWWAAGYIEFLTSEGVVSGYPDGTYKPIENTRRAQMAKMIVNSFNLPMCTMTH